MGMGGLWGVSGGCRGRSSGVAEVLWGCDRGLDSANGKSARDWPHDSACSNLSRTRGPGSHLSHLSSTDLLGLLRSVVSSFLCKSLGRQPMARERAPTPAARPKLAPVPTRPNMAEIAAGIPFFIVPLIRSEDLVGVSGPKVGVMSGLMTRNGSAVPDPPPRNPTLASLTRLRTLFDSLLKRHNGNYLIPTPRRTSTKPNQTIRPMNQAAPAPSPSARAASNRGPAPLARSRDGFCLHAPTTTKLPGHSFHAQK